MSARVYVFSYSPSIAMLRTTLIALRGYRGKKVDNKHETPLPEVSYNLIPAPMME